MRKLFAVLVMIPVCAIGVFPSEASDPAAAGYGGIIATYGNYAGNNETVDDGESDALAAIKDELSAGPGGFSDEKAYELEASFTELGYVVREGKLGYALRDLNNDDIPELIILADDYSISAVYSLVNEAPVLVGAYWSRNSCVIDAAGTLYISGSSGAADSSSASYSFRGGDELQLIEMVGVESYDEKTFETFPEGRYYRIQNGEKTVIDEEEAGILFKKFPSHYPENPTKDAGLVFVPF